MGGYKGVKTIKHMVWDWNGTLMNDVGLCLDITNQMLRRRGLAQVDSARYRGVFGFPLRDYCARIGYNLKRDSFELLSDEKLEVARQWGCKGPFGMKRAVFLIDEQGRVRYAHVEALALFRRRKKELLEVISALEEEPTSEASG